MRGMGEDKETLGRVWSQIQVQSQDPEVMTRAETNSQWTFSQLRHLVPDFLLIFKQQALCFYFAFCPPNYVADSSLKDYELRHVKSLGIMPGRYFMSICF